MAKGVKLTVQEAIRDTLRDNLSTYLTDVSKRTRPTFIFRPVVPAANQCPLIMIYDDGGAQEDFSGYVLRRLPFRVYVVVVERDEEKAAESAMDYTDAIRACLEENYTLGGVVPLTDITGEEPTGDPVDTEAGGVMQAGGITIRVTVGNARGEATL